MIRLTRLIAALFGIATATAGTAKPNLIVIHTDEHNFRTLGCYRTLLPKEQAFVWGDGVAVETPQARARLLRRQARHHTEHGPARRVEETGRARRHRRV